MPNGFHNQNQGRPPYRGGGQRENFGGHDHQEATIGEKTLSQWNGDIKNWVNNGIDKQTIVYADGMGKRLKEQGLTTSQIRNIFGEMRKIQMNGFQKEKANFLLLRPKLAYAAKRQNAKGMDEFYKLFCTAYDAVDTNDDKKAPKQFDQLLQVMEAVLAYHKFYGGQ